MAITVENVIVELRRSLPSFVIDPEWEAEVLPYPVFNDFARFICSEAEVLQYAVSEEERSSLSKVPDCMMFLENALADGDSAVRDLVRECVESMSECPWQEQIKAYAGPLLAAQWRNRL